MSKTPNNKHISTGPISHAAAAIAIATLFFIGDHALAQPVVIPPGLSGGDSYRLVFVTSTTRDALSGNIVDYNNFVNDTANAVPELFDLGTTFRVIGSTVGLNARDNVDFGGPNDVPIYALDGSRVANDNDDMFDASLEHPIDVDENGNAVGDEFVFTGTFTDGTFSGVQSFGAGPTTLVGSSASVTGEYLFTSIDDSEVPNRFYGLSAVLTVPEPTCGAWFLVGALLWTARRRGDASTEVRAG